MGRSTSLLVAACVGAVLLIGEGSKLLHLDPRLDVAPVLTAAGVVGAVVLFFLKETSDRRRKTLDAYEKQLYDRDLRIAYSTVSTALNRGDYESDTDRPQVGSLRDQTSLLINYLEVSCAGVERGLYERGLFCELMTPLAKMLIENFLAQPASGQMPSRDFLEAAESLNNMRTVFCQLFAAAKATPSPYAPRLRPDSK